MTKREYDHIHAHLTKESGVLSDMRKSIDIKYENIQFDTEYLRSKLTISQWMIDIIRLRIELNKFIVQE